MYTKHFLLLSLILLGTAVSISAQTEYRREITQGEVRLGADGGFFYGSELIVQPTVSSVLQGEGSVAVGVGVINGLELSAKLPFHTDVIDSFTTAGIGDLLFAATWKPQNDRPVRPVLSLHSIIPTGSNNKTGTPRYLKMWNSNNSAYSSDEFIISPEAGVELRIREVALPVTFAVSAAPQISLHNSEHIAMGSSMWVELFSVSSISPSLGFSMTNPLNEGSETAFSNGSYTLHPMVTVKRSFVDFGFKTAIGLGNATLEKNETVYKVDSDFGFEVSCNFYIGKRNNSKDISNGEETSSSEDIVAPNVLPQVDTVSIEQDTSESLAFAIVKDSDNDGILDDSDQCPEAKELYNGIDDLDGCPDFDKTKWENELENTILWGVEFASGTTSLSYESKKALSPLLNMMKKNGATKIELRGYSDHSGGYDTNIRISTKRAESVKSYLVQNGIEESRIDAVGYGANRPFADNRTSKGRKLNRRIEYVITEK